MHPRYTSIFALAFLLAARTIAIADNSIIDSLKPEPDVTVQKINEGMRFSVEKNAPGKLLSADIYSVPLTITAVAQTDSTNLRLFYGDKGLVIFNWELNGNELRYHDPKSGEQTGLANKGAIPKNKFVTVRWVLGDKQSRVEVDGIERVSVFNDYAGLSGKIGIGTNAGATISVKSLEVAQVPAASSSDFARATYTLNGSKIDFVPLKAGEVAYSNRRYLWEAIPSKLEGWQFSRINGGTKVDILVKAESAGMIYVASMGGQAVDLSGWERLDGVEFTYNDPSHTRLRVFRRAFKTGEEIHIPQGDWQGTLVLKPADNAPPLVAQVPAVPAKPTDPNAIERPEFREKPKPIAKSLTSIKDMVVSTSAGGSVSGEVFEIIANVPADSVRSGDAGTSRLLRDKAGDNTRISFDEAIRAVKVRYPQWSGGRIDVSFDDKYTALDGGSAGTAFAVLMLSALEGFDIDPKFAITGDITVNWRVLPIGGVPHKLAGAYAGKCTCAAIPEENETSFADMGLMESHDAYWNLQVFSLASVQQAVAIARSDRDPKLAEAIKLFAELKPQLDKAERATLAKPDIQQTLKHIVELAPNHLSAKYALALATNTAPKTLSETATYYCIYNALYPFRASFKANMDDKDVGSVTVPASLATQTRHELDILRRVGNKNLASVITEVSAFVETANSASSGTTNLAAYLARRKSIRARFANIVKDPDFFAKALRAGY